MALSPQNPEKKRRMKSIYTNRMVTSSMPDIDAFKKCTSNRLGFKGKITKGRCSSLGNTPNNKMNTKLPKVLKNMKNKYLARRRSDSGPPIPGVFVHNKEVKYDYFPSYLKKYL